MRKTLLTAFATLSMLAGTHPAVAQTGHDLFQQALVMERANGQLQDAIALYERIAEEFADDRELIAGALVQMGGCYEKLGNNEARKAYQRVVDEFGDQAEMAEEARVRLTALEQVAAHATTPGVLVRELSDEGVPSPDGRYLAYVDWGTNDISIRDLRSGESSGLTTTGRQRKPIQFGMDPAFSPDGRFVAYEWHHPDSESYYDLRIMPTDASGPPRVLYDTADFYVMGPAWSREGKHIAVARYPNDDSRTDLLWVSVDDGSVRVLDTYAPSYYQGISHSPDDRYIAYSVHAEGDAEHNDIHLASTDGSGARAIVQHPADDRLLGWVPGTDWVLFLSNRSNVWGAWAVRVVDGRVDDEPWLVHPGMGQAWPSGFTDQGDFHYTLPVRWFTTRVASFDIVTGEIDTARAAPLPGSTMTPEWSPDCTRLAYREERSDFQLTDYERPLRVFDTRTEQVRELAGNLSTSRPRWSPDGRYLVVAAYDENVESPDYHGGIYRIDVLTGDPELLVRLPREPAWWRSTPAALSADGRSLFYVRRSSEGLGEAEGPDRIIMRRDLQSGIERELYRDSNVATYPFSLSPDGRQLVFAVVDTTGELSVLAQEGALLMRLDLATGTIRELTEIGEAGTVESVTWTADGNHLVYPQYSDSGTTIWRVALYGGEPQRITDTFRFRGAIAADGTRIAYTTGGISSKSMVMENLWAVLQRRN